VREASAHIWDTWLAGGPFVGDDGAPHTRVTVDLDWWLNTSSGAVGNWDRGLPIRWWQACDDSQIETEVPNIKSVEMDWNLDSDAAECTITLYNQWMDPNDSWREDNNPVDLGNPGYFTWNRGASPDAQARWGHASNIWSNVIVPNALLRVYQGFGGRDKTVTQARADGNIIRKGVWLVDEVRVDTQGFVQIRCRDMAKLLIEQIIYPPLIPSDKYPLDYRRWRWDWVDVTNLIAAASDTPKRAVFSNSGNLAWGRGTAPYAYDGTDRVWSSVGNGLPTHPWAWEWVEADCGDWVDTIYVDPINTGAGYEVYIQIYENGAWQGSGTLDYNPAHIGRYHVGVDPIYEIRLPWVHNQGIAPNTPTEITLPRAYKAEKVRVIFTKLNLFLGAYRCHIREIRHYLRRAITETHQEQQRFPGNFYDLTDIIKDLLLWAGWWCYETVPANEAPEVYGNLEYTGIPADAPYENNDYWITSEPFDKLPVIDAITRIKEIVGFNFWVDDEGGVRFEPPNYFRVGNNFYEDGTQTTFVPEIDERLVLSDYSVRYGGEHAYSEMIITSYDPAIDNPVDSTTVSTRFVPRQDEAILRGMIRPSMIEVPFTVTKRDQEMMAQLITVQLWMQQRQGQLSCAANPAIQINDQVRIYERQTGETYIHYVRGVSIAHDLDSGDYTMTLTTNWMGDEDNWVINVEDDAIGVGSDPQPASPPYEGPPLMASPTPRYNEVVVQIQNRLKRLGYLPIDVDGLFGTETEDRVEAFQAALALTIDGIVGPQTWTALRSN
jgi:hypothetical protein